MRIKTFTPLGSGAIVFGKFASPWLIGYVLGLVSHVFCGRMMNKPTIAMAVFAIGAIMITPSLCQSARMLPMGSGPSGIRVVFVSAPDPIGMPILSKSALPNFGLDFRKQDLLGRSSPFQSRKRTEKSNPGDDADFYPIPNLDLLIEQFIRHCELATDANRILPWVYSTRTEMVVADFEDALVGIEHAGDLIDQSIHDLLLRDSTLDQAGHSLTEASEELDRAELTILLLFELAKLEL